MKVPEVKPYWDVLNKKRKSLQIKRFFDLIVSSFLLIILLIPMVIISIIIKIDSPGPVFYLQERITAYGRKFRIHKFRTMVYNADRIGTSVTVANDKRVTRIGNILRKYHLDEFPQLIDIFSGNMSFVGARPEIIKYVRKYEPEMRATLLMPAGLTSEASIQYRNENELLEATDDVDEIYLKVILPEKMRWNLQEIKQFSFFRDLHIIIKTFFYVYGERK